MSRPNALVRVLARLTASTFYRVDCVGQPPRTGAVLLLPNHPNALLDPALVWACAGRDVRFLAKSTLFAGPLRPLLAGAGAIPVYRRVDPGTDPARNSEAFAAVAAALADGDAICLFPEGISHSSGRLETLRTGAARMALAAEQHGTSVAIVPVGLNFNRKTAFRSRVTVAFGRPFSARDLPPAGGDDDARAVRALTDRIAEHMRRLLIEADPDADAALLDRVDRLYSAARGRAAEPADRLARRQTIAAGIERLRGAAPDKYDDLLLRLRRYDNRLRRFGLRDRHLDWQVSSRDAAIFAARELAFAVVLLPLCAAGLIVFFVPYHLTGWAARLSTRERDQLATAQVIAGTVIYGLWLAGLCAAAWRLGGRTGGLAMLILLPVLALASLVALEREAAVLDTVRSWLLLRRPGRDTRERLRRRRSELADVLDQVHQWLQAEGRQASSANSVREAGS